MNLSLPAEAAPARCAAWMPRGWRRVLCAAWLGAIAWLAGAGTAGAQDQGYFPVASLGGSVEAIAGDGQRIYLIAGSKLQTWDLAGGRPRRLDPGVDLAGDFVRMAAGSGLVYTLQADVQTSTETFQLRIFDLSRPERPRVLGELDLPGRPRDLSLHEGWLAVSAGVGGWFLVDARNPAAPRLAASLPLPAVASDLSSDHAAVISSQVVWLVDRRQPDAPEIIRQIPSGGSSVALAGEHVFWTAPDDRSIYFDRLAVEPEPRIDGFIPVELDAASSLRIRGDRLYVAAEHAIEVFSIEDPGAPRPLGSVAANSAPALELGFAEGRLLARSAAGDVLVLDSARPGLPIRADPPAEPRQLASAVARGERLFLAAGQSGFWTLDLADPTQPRVRSRLDLPNVRSIRLHGDIAYLACQRTGLFAVDLTDDPPRLLSNFKSPDEVLDLAIDGDRAYLASGRAGIRVADLIDPAAPRFTGAFEDGALDATSVALLPDRDLLLAAGGGSGLWVFDLGQPAAPEAIGRYAAPDHADWVTAVDGRAVVGYSGVGLRAFDLSQPDRPRQLDFLSLADLRGLGPVDSGPEGTADRLWLAAGQDGFGAVELGLDGRFRWIDGSTRLGSPVLAAGLARSVEPGEPVAGSVRELVYAWTQDRGLLLLEPRPLRRLWLPLLLQRGWRP